MKMIRGELKAREVESKKKKEELKNPPREMMITASSHRHHSYVDFELKKLQTPFASHSNINRR